MPTAASPIPLGMVGQRLGVDMHMVSVDAQPAGNLELAINRCHLSLERLVASPYASGLSALVDDESELGCACVDFGGGTTSMAVFMKGEFVHADAIAIGGQHVTNDIARGLSTRIEDAERLKTMHGSVLPHPGDEREILAVRPIGDDDEPANQVRALGAQPDHPAAGRGDSRAGPRPARTPRDSPAWSGAGWC